MLQTEIVFIHQNVKRIIWLQIIFMKLEIIAFPVLLVAKILAPKGLIYTDGNKKMHLTTIGKIILKK